MDDFGIWEVDEPTKASERLKEAKGTRTEALLEDVIVRNPEMLMPGLELVGRQLRTAERQERLDLLGIDSEGRLVLFELKREKLRRDAVAQAVDYASWLESLDDAELHKRITENSDRHGLAKIENFEEWYDDHDNWESLEWLRPVRIVLVGLGVDEAARRMVDWLAAKGVGIDLLTFLGFRHGDRMLLARQLESGDEAEKERRRGRAAMSRAEKNEKLSKAIESKVDDYEMRDWWLDALSVLGRDSKPSHRADLGINFYMRRSRRLSTGTKAEAAYKIAIVERGLVLISFFPAAVDLCLDEFEEMREVIPFSCGSRGRAPPTERVSEQWFCRLDESGWHEHKERIAELVRLVGDRWRDAAEHPPP